MARDVVYENVPALSRRVGDTVLASQNNATLLLGRDRVGPVDSGYGASPGAGSIHMIVGRVGPDPSPSDAATVVVSAKTDPDKQAETTVGTERRALSGLVGRADCVRIVARTDFKLSVGKAYIVIDADGRVTIEGDVHLGQAAAERIIRGDSFARFWAGHKHPTPSGLSGPPEPMPERLLSDTNKVK